MKYLIILLAIIQINFLSAQEFYTLDQVQTIEITFDQSNWDNILDAAYNAGTYTLASEVSINGTVFDSVGVKYKGNSTYQSNQAKNPFHIELDTYKEQDYEGYKDIKLSNVAKDPSFLREVLSYQVIRQYMAAPLSNYANVYVNGTLIGLYSNSESITKTFVGDRFGSKSNAFIKCNPPAGAGPNSSDYPNLEYLGEDSLNYVDAYEIKSDNGWDELIDLCDTLENNSEDIESILDVDRTLWMLALDNALVNLDSYIGSFKQNYYLYRDDNGRFIPIIWDLNESFAGFTNSGSGNLNNNTSKQQMSHLLHLNDSDFPLIQKLLEVPMFRRMYVAHYKTILLENFADGSYAEIGQALQDLIAPSVQADDNKFFTYNNFIDNLNSDTGGGGGGPGGGGGGGGSKIGITNLMDARSNYLLSQNDFTQTQPTISNISLSTATPIVNESLSITANVVDEERVFLGYRNTAHGIFTRVEMFDDGMHGDGAAGDQVYGVELLIERPSTQYYIYAENDNAGMFSPQRAEYEYHNISASTSSIVVGDLVINEFMASNDVTVEDEEGEFDDWIELYNNGSSAIDLEGYFLSDNFDNLMKWDFPEGTTIEADDYLIIWCDEDGEQGSLHTNFKLSASGESIFLVDPEGEVVDEITYTEQVTDISYGRFPNGTGDFQTMTPTFNGTNSGTSGLFDQLKIEPTFKIYPNPAHDLIHVEADEAVHKILIYNSSGMQVLTSRPVSKHATIGIDQLTAGLYFILVSTEQGDYASQSFVKDN